MITDCPNGNAGRFLCCRHRQLIANAGQLHRFPTRAEIKTGAGQPAPMTEDELQEFISQPV